ncbi:unnamed protein product [Pleuronectes platessa]|uniref:Uncharacterized protein n=1 Tax=Pleuronectes platessa TaxID=8262 RepID=A0A9N7VM10_PLEPL|nr:unnamed protein product [Pleuronectes platessa]
MFPRWEPVQLLLIHRWPFCLEGRRFTGLIPSLAPRSSFQSRIGQPGAFSNTTPSLAALVTHSSPLCFEVEPVKCGFQGCSHKEDTEATDGRGVRTHRQLRTR